MKLVNYEDVPAMLDQLLREVDTAGVTFQVMKNGRPQLRIEPVDEAILGAIGSKTQAAIRPRLRP